MPKTTVKQRPKKAASQKEEPAKAPKSKKESQKAEQSSSNVSRKSPKSAKKDRGPRRARVFKTKHLTAEEALGVRGWIHIDATNHTLGRLATRIATILRGKTKPTFSPHIDVGDFVVVTNASQIRLTGKKWDDKLIHHHTGYIGSLVTWTAKEFHRRNPDQLVRRAVANMLPKTRLGRQILKKLKVFPGSEHSHQAQKPKTIVVE